MMNSIQRLCKSVNIDGVEYQINTDFKVWIEIEHLFFSTEYGDAEKLAHILALAYPSLPHNPIEAVKGVLWFYSGGKDSGEHDEREDIVKMPFYDLKEDFSYVWGAFLSEFGIDLTEVSLHWWKFRALLCCLSEDCKFSKIVAYRSLDTSSIKDTKQRQFYEKMKRSFRLKCAFSEELKEKQLTNSLEGLF